MTPATHQKSAKFCLLSNLLIIDPLIEARSTNHFCIYILRAGHSLQQRMNWENYLNVSYVVADEKVTWARWNNGACLLTADLNVCLTSCTFLPFLFLSPGFIYVLRMHFSRHNTLTNVVAKSFHSTLKSQEWDLSVTSLMISILDSWVTKTRN